jgi:phage baseplate assembly protein W
MSSEGKPVLGSDVRLTETELGADLAISSSGDLAAISGELNLGQAIFHRLRTTLGELLDTGHSSYGSRLYDLIGEPNNEGTRERVRAMVRETLQREPRIERIVKISVQARTDRPDVIDIDVTVIAIETNVPLNVVFPFHLEVT